MGQKFRRIDRYFVTFLLVLCIGPGVVGPDSTLSGSKGVSPGTE